MAAEENKNATNQEKDKKKNEFGGPDFMNFKNPKKKDPDGGNFWIYIVIFAALALFSFIDFGNASDKITSTEFETRLRNGEIGKVVVVNKEYVEIYLNSSNTGHGYKSPDYTMTIGSVDSFEKKLENYNVDIEYQTHHNDWTFHQPPYESEKRRYIHDIFISLRSFYSHLYKYNIFTALIVLKFFNCLKMADC